MAVAPANTAYKGIAFAPTGQVLGQGPPTISLSTPALSQSIGDSYQPDSFTATVGDLLFTDPSQLTVTATSGPASAADTDVVSSVSVSGSGATRTITVVPKPATVGLSDITVTVTTPDERSATATLQFGVSPAAPDATSYFLYGSGSDASTAVDVGDGYYVVGDDEYNALALYKEGVSGPPVATWDFGPDMGVLDSDQLDIESSARVGDTIYWAGSQGNSSSGKVESNRAMIFATTVTGSGASTELSFAGYYSGLRSDLIAWDNSNGAQFGFAAGAASGQTPKEVNGLNIEGMEFAAGGSSTLYLGFRAPIVPPGDPADALVVPLTNVTSLMSTDGSSGGPASFGTPIEWNLTPPGYVNPDGNPSALGIREIRKNADDEYLIIAGSYEAVPAAPSGGAEYLYEWDDNAADQPILTDTVLPTPDAGSWETIVSVPDPLTQGSQLQMVQDDGDVDYYNDGAEAKDLQEGVQKDRADVIQFEAAAPTVTPEISGTLGDAGWYTSNVTVSWSITSALSASSCPPTTLTANTAGAIVSCTSTSGAGSTSASVTIKIDKAPPLITFSGNAGSYTVAQSVNISCSAVDPAPGSGIASSSCPGAHGPAWTFGLGTTLLNASATDVAGNSASASTGFTVTVTPASLCTLTDTFVQGSSKYQALNPIARAVVNIVVTGACNLVTSLTTKLNPAQAQVLINAYDAAIASLEKSGWLTSAQASSLTTFAAAL